ncbi:MAG: glutamate 5-kinase, partial [Microcoleus sp.]
MTKTIVVKIGTSTLTRSTTGNLALSTVAALVEVLADLRQQGH